MAAVLMLASTMVITVEFITTEVILAGRNGRILCKKKLVYAEAVPPVKPDVITTNVVFCPSIDEICLPKNWNY